MIPVVDACHSEGIYVTKSQVLSTGRTLKVSVTVLLNQRWVLSKNFTQLSLSSKTQCHVNRIVTVGPGFIGCSLSVGEWEKALCTDLGTTLGHVMLA